MRIFHVLTHFMPDQTAGTEMYVFSLQKKLQELGYEGGVIIPNFGRKKKGNYYFDGVRVNTYPQDDTVNDKVIKGIYPPSGLLAFAKLLDELKPDLLHFHEISGSNGITVFHLQVAKKKNIKILFTMHLVGYVCPSGTLMKNNKESCNGVIDNFHCTRCTLIHQNVPVFLSVFFAFVSNFLLKIPFSIYSWKGPVIGLLSRSERIGIHRERLKQIYTYCDGIVTLNKWFADMLLLNGLTSKKIYTIQQGLPLFSKVSKNDLVKKNFEKPLRLVFVGRIFWAKGLHLLLSALKKIPSNTYTLDIYGPYNDDDYLELCKKIINQNTSINFRGIIPPGETVSYLKKYHLLILPSVVTEMAPLVLQEAFAAGIPVIASHVYGNAEQIRHGYNGLLFRFNDVNSLRAQIQACMDDPTLLRRLAANIQPPAEFNQVAAAYHHLYQKLKSES